jgi:hypothetical protein
MSTVVRISTAVLLSTVCACGGATNAGPDESTTAQDVESYCDMQCDTTERCNPDLPPNPTCRPSCTEKRMQAARHVRAGYLRTYTSCMSQLECGEDSDTCSQEAADVIGNTAAARDASPEVQACREKEVACKQTVRDLDDVCDSLLLLVSSSLSQMARCFQNDCDAIPACIDPVFGN